jgi:hypothetical protein
MRDIRTRIDRLEQVVEDATPPPGTACYMPGSAAEEAELRALHQSENAVFILARCSRKCFDGCPEDGAYHCRHQERGVTA